MDKIWIILIYCLGVMVGYLIGILPKFKNLKKKK